MRWERFLKNGVGGDFFKWGVWGEIFLMGWGGREIFELGVDGWFWAIIQQCNLNLKYDERPYCPLPCLDLLVQGPPVFSEKLGGPKYEIRKKPYCPP